MFCGIVQHRVHGRSRQVGLVRSGAGVCVCVSTVTSRRRAKRGGWGGGTIWSLRGDRGSIAKRVQPAEGERGREWGEPGL